MRTVYALVLTFLLPLFPSPGFVSAHEGHDHGDAPRTLVPIAPRGEARADNLEIVAILSDGEIVVYLDRFQSNEPVINAEIEVLTPDGSQKAIAKQDGTYRLSAKWAKGRDHYDLIFTVSLDGVSEVLPVTIVGSTVREIDPVAGGVSLLTAGALAFFVAIFAFVLGILFVRQYPRLLRGKVLGIASLLIASFVYPAHSHDEDHAGNRRPIVEGVRDTSQRMADGSLFVPKVAQRLLTIRTDIAKEGEYSKTIELPGRIIPDPNASGYVQSSLAGRLLPPPNGFPALGAKVEKGQVLAYVEPPIQAIDLSDMRQKEGELLQQIAILERRVARFEKLIESNAVPRATLEDARTELESLRNRKTQLDKIRREPEVLFAPVSGVIAEANTIAGQLAQPSKVIFQIVNPERLWVEALSFEAFPAVEEASAQAHNGKSIGLLFRGSGAALRNQSIAVQFAIDGKADGVWVGQFVTVFVALKEKRSGILLPRTAVIRTASGQHAVFEHSGAERFEQRIVKVEALDAENMLVTGGIVDGSRIVVQGAELLDQVR